MAFFHDNPWASYPSPGSRGGQSAYPKATIFLSKDRWKVVGIYPQANPPDLFLAPNATSVHVFSQSRGNHSKIGNIHGGLSFDPATRYEPRLLGNDNVGWWGQHAKDSQDTFHATIQKEVESICYAVHRRMEKFERHQHSFAEVSVQRYN